MKWSKSEVSKSQVSAICAKYGVDAITASIMVRRALVDGKDVWPYLEDNTRYLHNPFLFDTMEDVVDRILDAAEADEDGNRQKVLVFGDRDVDGVTATLIMAGALKDAGCCVSFRVPQGDEPYGLSVQAVEEFAEEGGSLIVTVDCGISCAEAARAAAEHGIDVIVTDHHNVGDVLPDAIAIIDPKMPDCGYPFEGLSGAAVALKVSYALHFARLPYYKSEITMLDVHPALESEDGSAKEGSITVECIKTRNMAVTGRMAETFGPGDSIMDSRLVSFLSGQHIFVWDAKRVQSALESVFGREAEFALTDFRLEAAKTWKSLKDKTLDAVKADSRMPLYGGGKSSADALYNLFVAWAHAALSGKYKSEADDLCLAALSSMADIMPMTDENRIIVKAAMKAINRGKVRRGLTELMAHQAISPETVTARDLSWTVIPALNAAGRMGKAQLALDLLSSDDAAVRESLAGHIVALNDERKRLVGGALSVVGHMAKESLKDNASKIIAIIDGRIAKGVTGLVASRLSEQYGVPAIVATSADGVVTGSMRSPKGVSCTEFLSRFAGLFIDYGGHNSAAGFSLEKAKQGEFCAMVKESAKSIEIEAGTDEVSIDAEIPPNYVSKLPEVVDFFSPFGTGNEELLFMTRGLDVCNAVVLGKSERQHLKLTVDCGKVKCPAMIWGGAELLGSSINIGDKIDLLYSMTRNTFGGITTPQMIIKDWRRG